MIPCTDLDWHALYTGKIRDVAETPRLKAGWEHEFGDTALPIDAQLANRAGSTFLVHGPATGRDSALLEAGVSAQWKPGISAYLISDARLNSTYQSHSITGGMSFSF